MPRRFLIDYGEEEDIEETEYVYLPPGHAVLPRYLLSWGELESVTRNAQNEFATTKGLWMIKFKILEATSPHGRRVVHEDPTVTWAIGLNEKRRVGTYYWIDVGKKFPAVVGARGTVVDKNGATGIIELMAEPQPAPWW